jgi:ferredoxin
MTLIRFHATPSSLNLDHFKGPEPIVFARPGRDARPDFGYGRSVAGEGVVRNDRAVRSGSEELRVWVDQDLCTGDGLCVQYAPEVFEFDVDGLAYVKDGAGELRLAPGSRVDVPTHLRVEVVDAARECPGECIHVLRGPDDTPVAGPRAA